MEENYLTILEREFFAEDGSFILKLRLDNQWDRVAFDQFLTAMQQCCQQYTRESYTKEEIAAWTRDHQTEQSEEPDLAWIEKQLWKKELVARWLAEGFWEFSQFVREWTSSSVWNNDIAREPDYFSKAYKYLDELAVWFFTGSASSYILADQKKAPASSH